MNICPKVHGISSKPKLSGTAGNVGRDHQSRYDSPSTCVRMKFHGKAPDSRYMSVLTNVVDWLVASMTLGLVVGGMLTMVSHVDVIHSVSPTVHGGFLPKSFCRVHTLHHNSSTSAPRRQWQHFAQPQEGFDQEDANVGLVVHLNNCSIKSHP